MQFDFEEVKKLLGKVVYIQGQTLPNLEPFMVCGYDHIDDFLQMHSLTSGQYISGIHPSQVCIAQPKADSKE